MRGPGVLGDWFGIWVVWKFGWSKVVNVTPDYDDDDEVKPDQRGW